MKQVAAAAIFVASLCIVPDIRAGAPAPERPGRPGADVPAGRGPQPDPAPADGTNGPVALDEGFEQADVLAGGIFANGWFRQNNSDDPVLYWRGNIPLSQNGRWDAFDGPEGSALLNSYRSTQANGGTISDWVVTPLINFGSGSTLTFHTRTASGSTYPDRLQVRACSSGPCTRAGLSAEDVGDFTTLLLDINPSEAQGQYPEDWTAYTLGFAAGLPQSGSGRIAFRYYVHDSGQFGTRGNVIGLDRVVVASGQPGAGPLGLSVTVAAADASDPQHCGSATSIDVSVGDQVNTCYTVTNNSSDTLNYQYLRDDRTGALLTQQAQAIAPGASLQYNRIVTIGESQAPSSTWTAQTGPWGYAYTTSPVSEFVDISGDGTPIPAQQYPQPYPFPADFDFLFYGEPVRKFCLVPAGIFESVHDFCYSTFTTGVLAIPNVNFIDAPAIIPFWAFNAPLDGGHLYSKMVGAAPNRQFILQWTNIPFFSLGELTFQIVLHETSHVIEFRYAGDYGEASWRASIGLQNQWLGNPYSFYSNNLAGVGRVIWTPADRTAYTATRQVAVNAGVPALALNPAAVTAAAPSHGTASAALAVANAGSGRLDWSVQSAAAASNMPLVRHFVRPLGDRTQVSFGRAPTSKSGHAKAVAAGTSAIPLGSGDRYAFAIDLTQAAIRQFDPNAIDGADLQGPLGATRFFTGGTFLDNDFSKFYVFDAANSQLLWYELPLGLYPEQHTHLVGNAAVPVNQATGLKQDPTSGAVYLSTTDGETGSLWTIDPATAAVRFIGSTPDAPGLIDIAFDAAGNLYGVDIALDALVAIDKTTGEARPIGSLGFDANYSSGLAFDYQNGQLYFSSIDVSSGTPEPGLWRIDTLTGEATLVGPIPSIDQRLSQWDALAIAHAANDVCDDPANVPWLSLNPTRGSVHPEDGATTVHLSFDASALDDGTYSANLCLYSNDLLHRHRSVPVTFTVGTPADRIFASGFENASP